ncbi:hypothetical protein HDU67_006261 [Dinochytrium kinnereticum]|nr:hypothetical protein HDU67_006261 [Dinochytrium kinnereticum]
MALVPDRGCVIYRMRQSVLRMEDALVERIITLPNPDENDYTLMQSTGITSSGAHDRVRIPKKASGAGRSFSSFGGDNSSKPHFIALAAHRKPDRHLLSERIHHFHSVSNQGSDESSVSAAKQSNGSKDASVRSPLRPSENSSIPSPSDHANDDEDPSNRAKDIESLREQLLSSHRSLHGFHHDIARKEKDKRHKRTISDSLGKDSGSTSIRSKEHSGVSRLGMLGAEVNGDVDGKSSHSSLPTSVMGSRRGSAARVDSQGSAARESETVSLANSFKQSLKADALAQANGTTERRLSIASSAESIHVEDLELDADDANDGHDSLQQPGLSLTSKTTGAASLRPPTVPRSSEVKTSQSIYASQGDEEIHDKPVVSNEAREEDLRAYFQKVSLPKTAISGAAQSLEEKATKSALSKLLKEQNTSDNPFAADFSFFSGKGDPDPVKLKIYIPFSNDSEKPLLITTKKEATVEEVIGYSLYEYTNESREPPIPEHLWDVANWNMRIVEDDGSIDEDFPVRFNEANRQATSRPVITQKQTTAIIANLPASPPRTILLKVHLYSTLEVKQTTTIPNNLQYAHEKRKYDPKNYVLKMADTRTDVPLDKTLESLKVQEFCVLKRDRGGAGDIFLRPPDEVVKMDTIIEQPRFISDEYSSMYKQYYVMHKMLMGKHERLLTIDGDHIHLMPAENKRVFDIMKTTSYHCSSIMSCKQTKKQSPHFKLVVKKGNNGTTTYDLEASTSQEAADACAKVAFIVQMNQRQASAV